MTCGTRSHPVKDGNSEVHELMGMWPLKPDADLVEFTKTLAFSEFWDPPTLSFSKATTLLGLICAARWFVGTSAEAEYHLPQRWYSPRLPKEVAKKHPIL